MNQDSATEQPKASIDGLTDAQLERLEAATDRVIQDIHKQERGVTPVAGLQGISEEKLRHIIKSALRHRMRLTAIDERRILELEGEVSIRDALVERWEAVVNDITARLEAAEEKVDYWHSAARRADAEAKGLRQDHQSLIARAKALVSKIMGGK